jgi:phosphohistidine swiveling domain-containing protein
MHDYYLEHGQIPLSVIDEIKKIKESLGGKIVIRSSANIEDGEKVSMAGVFDSHYVSEDSEISEALRKIFDQARSETVDQVLRPFGKMASQVNMGIIVQRLVEPEISGVIYTEPNTGKFTVQYVKGLASDLVDGNVNGYSLLANQEGVIESSIGFDTLPIDKLTMKELSLLVSQINTIFDGQPQDIEFVVENGRVLIVQSRPETVGVQHKELEESPVEYLELSVKRKIRDLVELEKQKFGTSTSIFYDANYSELLPAPLPMDVGVYQYTWGGLNDKPGAKQLGHADVGYTVPEEANQIIHYIGGRVYASLNEYAAIYHAGFPETSEEYVSSLVENYLHEVNQEPEKGAYPQMGLFLQDPSIEDLENLYGEKAAEYHEVYKKFEARLAEMAHSFIHLFETERLPSNQAFLEEISQINPGDLEPHEIVSKINQILEHTRTVSYFDFVRAARLGFYYSQKAISFLKENLKLDDDQAKKLYSVLHQGLSGSAITEANIAISQAKTEDEALSIALDLIGHFSTGEMLEIRHKPMHEDIPALTRYVRGIRNGNYAQAFENQQKERERVFEETRQKLPEKKRERFSTIIEASQTYMALRETEKYEFTKEYMEIRRFLESIQKKLGLNDGDIYYLYPHELNDFINNPQQLEHLIAGRKISNKHGKSFDMPKVIREQDIDAIDFLESTSENFSEAIGAFLANGESFVGQVVNIDDFDDLDVVISHIRELQSDNRKIILVAKQMNLSHDPLIVQADGLVIENCGLMAHGAQRARELGKGAIGSIRSKQLKTGLNLSFEPANKKITVIN